MNKESTFLDIIVFDEKNKQVIADIERMPLEQRAMFFADLTKKFCKYCYHLKTGCKCGPSYAS